MASNTACANILVPILSQMSISLCSNPLTLMMTCAVCVSYAFMLPVATAPNAIIFRWKNEFSVLWGEFQEVSGESFWRIRFPYY